MRSPDLRPIQIGSGVQLPKAPYLRSDLPALSAACFSRGAASAGVEEVRAYRFVAAIVRGDQDPLCAYREEIRELIAWSWMSFPAIRHRCNDDHVVVARTEEDVGSRARPAIDPGATLVQYGRP